MIDFRYHLVSLVSVFVALAVGIVLGAGPLRGEIADSLKNQVAELSAERTQHDAELKVAKAGVANRDTFLTSVLPSLVGQQLGGRSVVLVTLPGADGDAVKPLTQSLQAAGARVTGRIEVKDAWMAADKAAARQRIVDQWAGASSVPSSASPLAAASPAASPSTGSTAGFEAVLARALVTRDLAQAERPDATAKAILESFAKEGMLAGDVTGRATEAILLAPGVEQATLAGADNTPTPTATTDVTPLWTALAAALDDGSDGAVVVGPASSATAGGVVAAVRAASEVAKRVSTVDTGGSPMGDVTTVLALREQLGGVAGAYGFGKAAGSPLPAQPGTA